MTDPDNRSDADTPGPKAAMVFAAGLGTRMRPITDSLPKPLVKVAGRTLIDHCLDRLADNGVERAIVNIHWLADQMEAHLASRTRPKIIISDERDQLLDQGGGVKRALPLIGEDPFLICNTDAFWIEGPRSNLKRLADAFDPDTMDILLLVASSATAIGVDWSGDFTMTPDGRLKGRDPRHVAPFVYTGVGIVKPQLFASETRDVFRLAPFFHTAAAKGRLFGLRLDGLWIHVGRPETIPEAERAIERSIL
jgi:N-acetyl-alpha-D-muramate 1-phosphate uridylyltransferase